MKRVFAVLAALTLFGCEKQTPCGEPFYGGKGSDEVWFALFDAEGKVKLDDPQSASWVEPSEGQSYPASGAAPMLRWTTPLTASRSRPMEAPRRGLLSELSSWVIGEAWAHLPPVTGPVHLLQIDVPTRVCPIRAVTTETQWQVNEEAWTVLKATAGQTLSAKLTSAYLSNNRITEGPYRGSSARTFQLAP